MSTRQLTLTALMTALMCIVGPLTLPVGPVPVSLMTAVLMLTAALMGGKLACVSCGVYLLLGLLGLPVLSGFTGSAGQLLGPTGGYLLGYLPMTAICGTAFAQTGRRIWHALAMLAGTLVLYAVGTAWYCLQAQVSLSAALTVCVLPFLPFDAVKIIVVAAIAPGIQKRLRKAGLLK